MTWGLAKYAARLAATVFSRRVSVVTGDSTGLHGPASNTDQTSSDNGGSTCDLTRRAMRLHNRKRAAVNLYLSKHKTLAKGVCSNG